MNHADLDKLLKSVPVPERSGDYWEDFPKAVVRRLGFPESSSSHRTRRRRAPLLLWGLGLTTACLAAGFFLGFGRGRGPTLEPTELAAMRKYYREVSALFPRQIRAIAVDERGSHLALSEQADLPDAQPLYVKICSPTGCQRVVTFSGQQVRVNGELCDVLLNREGQVLVVGDGWVWSGAQALAGPARYLIQARTLEEIL